MKCWLTLLNIDFIACRILCIQFCFNAAVPSSTQSTRIGTMHCGPGGPVFPTIPSNTVKSTQQYPTVEYSSLPRTATAQQYKTSNPPLVYTSKRSPDGSFEDSSTGIRSSKSSYTEMVYASQRPPNQSFEESITGV